MKMKKLSVPQVATLCLVSIMVIIAVVIVGLHAMDDARYRAIATKDYPGDAWSQFTAISHDLSVADMKVFDVQRALKNSYREKAITQDVSALLQATKSEDVRAFALIYGDNDSFSKTWLSHPSNSNHPLPGIAYYLATRDTQAAYQSDAAPWLLRAAAKPGKSALIYRFAGNLYATGSVEGSAGVPLDYNKALHAYEEEWRASDVTAAPVIALLYRNLGDPVNAYLWGVRTARHEGEIQAAIKAHSRNDAIWMSSLLEVRLAITAMYVCPDQLKTLQELADDRNVMSAPDSMKWNAPDSTKCPAAAVPAPPSPFGAAETTAAGN
jgi:hypothetical protein